MNTNTTFRRAGVVVTGFAALALVAGCSTANDAADAVKGAASAATSAAGDATDAVKDVFTTGVTVKAADGTEVKLVGPIAVRYAAATDAQKADLGAPLTGPNTAGSSDSGVVYQQFAGGVITAKNGDQGTPAYITWGKIRDAWNVPRNAEGVPAADGKGGSQGPLGAATSDESVDGDLKKSTFEHGAITFNTADGTVTVTVNDKVVPAG